MTDNIIQLRDYETAEERQIKIERLGLRIVEEALDEKIAIARMEADMAAGTFSFDDFS